MAPRPKQKDTQQMLSITLGAIGFLLVLGLVIIFTMIMIKKQEQQSPPPKPDTSIVTSKVKNIDSTWNVLHNSRMGFDIKIPKLVLGPSRCLASSTSASQAEWGLTPLSFWENEATLLLSTPQKFQGTVPYDGKGRSINNCALIPNSLESWASAKPAHTPAWLIETTRIQKEDELLPIIHQNMGFGCYIKNTHPARQTGVVDIEIAKDPKAESGTTCDLSTPMYMKYAEKKEKVVYWTTTATPTFLTKDGKSYDTEMADSLQFID